MPEIVPKKLSLREICKIDEDITHVAVHGDAADGIRHGT